MPEIKLRLLHIGEIINYLYINALLFNILKKNDVKITLSFI